MSCVPTLSVTRPALPSILLCVMSCTSKFYGPALILLLLLKANICPRQPVSLPSHPTTGCFALPTPHFSFETTADSQGPMQI
jgi:hypothetical protein